MSSNTFIIDFPSSELLEYAINWGDIDTKTVQGKIRFEKNKDNEVYKYDIDKLWVQFRGFTKELREFSIIWAIGSILGVPKMVDMKFTKRFRRCRMRVAVLDPELIPNVVDVVIGDQIIELQFRVEDEWANGVPKVIDMDTKIEDKKPEEEKSAEDPEAEKKMDVDAKKR